MKKLPRIITIKSFGKPLTITANWTDGTRRLNYLNEIVANDERFKPLLDFKVFSSAVVADGTLSWPNVSYEIKDMGLKVHLDLDPDVLYQNSYPVGSFDPIIEAGKRIMARRITLGMSQEDLGKAIGADRAYVSRIESGKQNITMNGLVSILKGLNSDFDLLTGLIGGSPKKERNIKKV